MPNWLHNTLNVILLIVTMRCAASGIKWKTNKETETN